jgi:hypothetical protein
MRTEQMATQEQKQSKLEYSSVVVDADGRTELSLREVPPPPAAAARARPPAHRRFARGALRAGAAPRRTSETWWAGSGARCRPPACSKPAAGASRRARLYATVSTAYSLYGAAKHNHRLLAALLRRC